MLSFHYHCTYRTNSCGNAIAKPQAFSCSPLLCYRFVTTTLTAQIPNGNAIANLLGSLHAETGFSYFGARYYDSDLMTGWLSVDPLADDFSNISPYNYCNWNPVKLKDPDGNIPLLANIAGAALVAAVDIAGQVVSNYFAKEPIGNINWTSVGISAAEGALTAGGSVVKNLGVKTAAIADRSYSKCEGSIEKFYNEVAEEAVGELHTLGVKVKGPKPKTMRNTQAVAKVKEKGYVSSKQASEINAKNQAQNKKI